MPDEPQERKMGEKVYEFCEHCGGDGTHSGRYVVFPPNWTKARVREWWKRNRDSEIQEPKQ